LNNLKKVDAYSRLINEGIPSLILDGHISNNELTDSFAKQLAIFVIQKSLDPTWVENQTGKLVNKIAESFRNYKGEATLDLSETKDVVTKVSAGLMIFDNMLPACDKTQPSTTSQALLGKVMDAETNCEVKSDLKGIREQVDKINVGVVNLDEQVKNANAFIVSVQHFSSNIKFYFWFSLISLFLLLGLIIILEINHISFMAKLVSIALMVASGITFFGSLLAQSLISTAYSGAISNPSGPIKAIAGDFIASSVSGIFTRLEIVSAIVFGVFLAVLVLASLILKKEPRR